MQLNFGLLYAESLDFNQTWRNVSLHVGDSIFVNNRPFDPQKGDDFFIIMLWHYHCFAQLCLVIRTVSQVSDVAHRPLVKLLL